MIVDATPSNCADVLTSIVVVDEGVGKSLTRTTITQDVYAFIFDQRGLMAGVGIQGSKITKLSVGRSPRPLAERAEDASLPPHRARRLASELNAADKMDVRRLC
jgi:hypothetical protein